LRLGFASQVQRGPGIRREILVRLCLFFPVEVIRRRNRKLRKFRQLCFFDHDDAIWIREIEWPQEDDIDDGKNGGAGANAQGKREDGDNSKARRLDELPKCVAESV